MRAILLFILTAAAAGAQTIEVQSLFQPAPLSGVWKHHAGDDQRWADPAFDDSAWPGVRMPEAAAPPGYGFSWYRFRVRLPETMPKEPLALMVGGFGNSQAWEVFWNGQRAGAMGELDGGAGGLLIAVPKAIPVAGHGREAVVAIRLRSASGRFAFTSSRTSWIGTEASIGERVATWRGERLRQAQPQMLIAASLLLSAVLFLLLPLWRRDAPEYFWFGLWLLSGTVNRHCSVNPDIVGLEGSLAATWITTLAVLSLAAGWLGWMRTLFSGRLTQTVWLASAACGALFLGIAAFVTAGGNTSPFISFLSSMLANCYFIFVYYQVGWRTSRETDRMPFVHIAILAYLSVNFVTFGAVFFWPTEAVAVQGLLARAVTALLFVFAMTIVMNQRSARLLGERQRLAREMESAAELQSLLLTSLPAAGDSFRIEPVYLPATEVGGDFYRVFSADNGAILVVVGDVSGKGLRAAMTVSVLVGAMEAIRTRMPGAFLEELNRAASAHMQSGFATCCAALIRPNGEAVIANAGHPSPYCDGRELEVEGGLPLGIAPEVTYPESVTRGERFTFVSDGVVEAASAKNELFGFDRTREISSKSASEIAEAAKAWGQNDDITVVTVRTNG